MQLDNNQSTLKKVRVEKKVPKFSSIQRPFSECGLWLAPAHYNIRQTWQRFYTQDECQPLSKARRKMLLVKFHEGVYTQMLLGAIVPDNPLQCLAWVRPTWPSKAIYANFHCNFIFPIKKKGKKKRHPSLLYCLALDLVVGCINNAFTSYHNITCIATIQVAETLFTTLLLS